MKYLRLALQILLPITVLGAGVLLTKWIAGLARPPMVTETRFVAPFVRTLVAASEDRRIDVSTQGTVEPFRAIDVAAEVGGRILDASSQLRAGGFFAAGEVLVEIDPADYRLAIVQQEANVARAELRLVQEHAEADAAVRAWKELEGQRAADPLVVRTPQIHDAEANLAAAKAQLQKAHLDLDRTQVKAPFAGRVRAAHADVGQMVQPGQALAQIYGIEFAEVRLPIPSGDAAFLDLPMQRSDSGDSAGATVDLSAEFGGNRYAWQGTIVRTEGEIDRRTRQINVIARVANPYAQTPGSDRPPLSVGMFAEATIHGRTFPGVITVPRTALQKRDEIWVVDDKNTLRRHRVTVLRIEPERVLLRSGVEPGERVCILPPETPSEGMPVRLADQDSDHPTPRKGD